jgi:anti-sigma-K factor RskA
MPGKMSLAENDGPEREGDETFAAEYVVGGLPADERQVASRRIDNEAAFARLVDQWEVHLAPMADAYQPVEPPDSVKTAIDRRLLTDPAAATTARGGLWASLAFWRGLAAAALAALATYVAVPYLNPLPETPDMRLVAALAAQGSDVRYLAMYDAAWGEVGLSHVSGQKAADRDFELWIIEGQNPPVSLGLVPAGPTVHITLTPEIREKLASGAVLAISLEPAGGSPTGQPTGPVVAAGDLKSI